MMSLALACCCALFCALDLEEGFLNPPREAKPHTWYHLMNGNVTKEGITRDFEELSAAGVGGVQMFDAGCAIPAGPLKFNSPEWFDLLKHAASEAKRLDLELCIPNCSGWSSSGGPWNPASNAMKKVVFTETRVKGGSAFTGRLAAPPNPCGFYRDIAVLAVPVPPAKLLGYEGQAFSRTTERGETATVLADREIEASGYSLRLEFTPMWRALAHLTVEVSRDGVTFEPFDTRTVALTLSGHGSQDYRFFAFEKPRRLRGLRIAVRFENPLSTTRPVTGKATGLRLERKLEIMSLPGKTLEYRSDLEPPTKEGAPDQVVPKEAVVDLTKALQDDGSLCWTAPASAAEWAVLRFGYATIPSYNHPASASGRGFEVDKLSAAAMDFHFEQYIGRLCRYLGPLAGGETGLNNILVDSYEVGSQNWTQGFETIFRARRGYDLTPYLPAFAGYIVGNVAETEGVLRDFRRVVADLFAENYAGALAKKCHQYGLKLSLEPYGSGPFDNLQYGRHADIPMGEFWSKAKHPGYCDDAGNSKYVSYVGHVWGKKFIGTESFTANPIDSGAWLTTPELIKPLGDAAYADGVNRIVYHRFVHQPWPDDRYVPGLTMGQWGMHFDRHNTWWPYAKAFLAYQARCQFLLQQGEHVADVLFYCGDEAPNQGGNTDGIGSSPYSLPYGYDWDVCETEALRLLKFENGRVVAPGGATYRRLIRPPEREAGFSLGFEPDVRVLSGGVEPKWDHRRTSDSDIYFICRNNATNESFDLSFRVSGRIPELWDAEKGTITAPRAWRAENGRTTVLLDFETCGSIFVVFRDSPSRSVRPYVKRTTVEERTIEGLWRVSFAAKYEDDVPKPRRIDRLMSWTESDDSDLRHFSGTATYETELAGVEKTASGERLVLDLGEVKNFAEVSVNGRAFPVLWKPPYRVDITEAVVPGVQRLSVRVTNLWPNRLIGDDALPADVEWLSPQGKYQPIKEIPQWVKDGKKSPTGRHTFTTWRFWKAGDPLLPSGLLGPVRLQRGR